MAQKDSNDPNHQPLELHADLSVEISMPSVNGTSQEVQVTVSNERLKFHSRCGSLVKISNNGRSAERRRPLEEFNNGVVMTHRPLHDNELFEIRIDHLVDKWSGSIEVGVTTHNPTAIEFPATMTNMHSGTIMMSGCGILMNGKGTLREYGHFNLDELREGDRVGMMRKSNGNLHYFINGIDQGSAASRVAPYLWGVIDLYGMTVKVSIMDTEDNADRIQVQSTTQKPLSLPIVPEHNGIDRDPLLFHPCCGSHVFVINDGKTAHRSNASENFNDGVVLTGRTLRPNELFQVRLERVVSKWAGSIEIGVTLHAPTRLNFPYTMTNIKSGTWMMTGDGVMHNGTTLIGRYGRNLDRLVEGDLVGVVRREGGALHFLVNGVDQGPAAFHVPPAVFGVIDLYGCAAQASIVGARSPAPPGPSPPASDSLPSPQSSVGDANSFAELRFHRISGCNVKITNGGTTAMRRLPQLEFSGAIIFSNRPLRECEMFEVRIDEFIGRWTGGLEFGVTALRPEEIAQASSSAAANGDLLSGTATELAHTVVLSGTAVWRDGNCILHRYDLDLDALVPGSRVGLMWHADGGLHYYLDGVDRGRAAAIPHLAVYAVLDLYGQCVQVTIAQTEERGFGVGCNSDNSLGANSRNESQAVAQSPSHVARGFSEYCGSNIFVDDFCAWRKRHDAYDTLVFSASHLVVDEPFEVGIVNTGDGSVAGELRCGLTNVNILNAHVNRSLPPTLTSLPAYTAYVDGDELRDGDGKKRACVPSLSWLRQGDHISFCKTSDRRLTVSINGTALSARFHDVPDKVYCVLEIRGSVTCIGVSWIAASKIFYANKRNRQSDSVVAVGADDGETVTKSVAKVSSISASTTDTTAFETLMSFSHMNGKNVSLSNNGTTATRVTSYNEGVAFCARALIRGQGVQFRIDGLNPKWTSSLTIGAVAGIPSYIPDTVLQLEYDCWLVADDVVNLNGYLVQSTYGANLPSLGVGATVTLKFTDSGDLHLIVNNEDWGAFASLPNTYNKVYAVVDVYGQCERVSIVNMISAIENEVNDIEEEEEVPQSDSDSLQQYEKADLEQHEKETVPANNCRLNESRNLAIQSQDAALMSSPDNEMIVFQPE